jgi:YHS domain-containing protein
MEVKNEPKVSIKKRGVGMNSKKLERRYMYLYVTPFSDDDLETGVRKITDALNRLLAVWKPPAFDDVFRPSAWWEHMSCPYCLRRMEYENERWKRGEYVWRRNLCLRHWFVYHFDDVVPYEPYGLLSNQPISIEAGVSKMLFSIETVNYKYDIRVDKETAEMRVEYKGRVYEFAFKNHLRGFPYASSYAIVLLNVYRAMRAFRDFLAEHVLRRNLWCNVIINDAFALPPSPDNAGSCPACKL